MTRKTELFFKSVNLGEMVMCLEDLINYFAQPEEEMGENWGESFTLQLSLRLDKFEITIEHEEKQNRLRALRNRQDLLQQEGILNLILDAIDLITVITSQGFIVAIATEEAGQHWDVISGYLYQLLGKIHVRLLTRKL